MKDFQTLAKENEQTVRKMYSAFQAGKIDEVVNCLAPDVFLTIPGRGMNAGEYWGHDGFRDFFSNIMGHYGGRFLNDVVAFASSDKHVFVREFNVLNRREDPTEDWQLPMVMLYTLRNGKISHIRVIPEYPDVYDAYWIPAAKNPRKDENLFVRVKISSDSTASIEQYDFMVQKYHAFWDGDYSGFRSAMTNDTVFFLAGNSSLAGTYKGYDGYLAFRNKLVSISGTRYQLMVEAFAASDTDVFVLEHIYQNTIYDPVPGHVYVLMHFMMDGCKILRANDLPLDTDAYEKFYGKKSITSTSTI